MQNPTSSSNSLLKVSKHYVLAGALFSALF